MAPSAAHGWAWRMHQTKRESEKQSLYDIAYMWNLKVIQRMSTQNRNRLSDVENVNTFSMLVIIFLC